jgi:hypothetical protein
MEWNLHQYPFLPTQCITKNQKVSLDVWTRPPIGFIQLNFDGAAKGNLGLVRAGGAFMDETRSILCIYVV